MTKDEERIEGSLPGINALPGAFRAGEWIVDPALNSLRRDDEDERHVEPKVMKVLLALAAHPKHVVPKEELMATVWPETFVSDDVLTRCISVLRRVTHDDPQSPKFIQTVPKVGYRLVAELADLPAETLLRAPAPATLPPPMIEVAAEHAVVLESTPNPAPSLLASAAPLTLQVPPARKASHFLRWVGAGFVALILMAIAAVAWLRRPAAAAPETFRTIPFTSREGEQLQPAFSPDGKAIAFVAVSEDGTERNIEIKTIGSDSATEITSGPGQNYSPVWSPDGRQLAYLSRSSDQLALYTVAATAGATPRRVFIPQEETDWEQGALSWSPDGKSLVFPDHAGSSPSASLFELDLNTLAVRALTTPPNGWEGDLTPAYSPDGKTIAFTRASETAVRDVYQLNRATGEVQPVTRQPSNIGSIAWSPDGKSVLFSSNRGGKFALWKTAVKTGRMERMPVGTEDAFQPAVSADGRLQAYTQGAAVWSILQVTAGGTTSLVSSTQQDSAPSLSPDGSRFAFQSQRSGFQEIWTAKAAGTDLQQLTHRNGPLTGSPSWSHDGRQILFDSRAAGHSHVYVIAAQGGEPRQLTTGEVNDIVPRWSHDDAAVYFRSNRGGRWQLWRMALSGGSPQPMTTGDGIAPQESADGKLLYYTRGGEDGIWSMPVSGGQEKQILSQPLTGLWGYWELTPQGIYYLNHEKDATTISIFHPQTGRSTVFAKAPLSTQGYEGLAVSADGRTVLLTNASRAGRHITLVEKSE